MIQTKAIKEFDADIKKECLKLRSTVKIDSEDKDSRIVKYNKVEVRRPGYTDTKKTISSPWWDCKYQWGPSVPRDTNVTLGNTILEAAMSFRCRYFDTYAYRDVVYDLWNKDRRVRWLAAPRPSMTENMYHPEFYAYDTTYE